MKRAHPLKPMSLTAVAIVVVVLTAADMGWWTAPAWALALACLYVAEDARQTWV